jgi:hypothetical protein
MPAVGVMFLKGTAVGKDFRNLWVRRTDSSCLYTSMFWVEKEIFTMTRRTNLMQPV